MAERRYPLEPILRLTGWSHAHVQRLAPCSGTEYRDRKDRGVTERIADRLAVAAGLHPYAVWPEMIDHLMADCVECGERFTPIRPDEVCCGKRCRERRRQRDRYQNDPAFAEATRERSRRMYEEAGEYKRAQSRRYYELNRERVRARQQAARARARNAA